MFKAKWIVIYHNEQVPGVGLPCNGGKIIESVSLIYSFILFQKQEIEGLEIIFLTFNRKKIQQMICIVIYLWREAISQNSIKLCGKEAAS